MCKKYTFILLLQLIFNSIYSQTFIEVSATAGVNHIFKEDNHMGGGVVFFDYDNDGWEDIYITGGLDKDQLYKNLGDGTFDLVTGSWLEITQDFYTTSVVSGDINNDGFRDLYVTTWRGEDNNGGFERNLLFMNNNGDGTFTEVGSNVGITETAFSMGAAMFDYNNDGLLDIYSVNYIEISGGIYDSDGNLIGFDHDCFENFLHINNGNGVFTEAAQSFHVNNAGCGLAVTPSDYDQDHDLDIYIANDFGEFIVPNTMLENNHPDNSFTDVSGSTGMNIELYGMGIAYGDFDKDQDYDYYITNLGRNVLLENDGSQNFTDITTTAGVENTYAENNGNTLFTTGWGAAFLDVNNDTWPDLFVANGRVPAAEFIATGEDDPNKLYINNGDSTFNDISDTAGVNDYNRGRGMAYCDYDKDGDLDIIVVVIDSSEGADPKTMLYQNQLNPNGADGKNWVQVSLEGTTINRDAIGAKVELTVDGEKLIQEVHGQGSHASQHSLVLHFGLGSNTSISEMKVIWTATDTQTFTDLSVNRRYDITQGQPLSISENDINSQFLTFPNPVKDRLKISGIDQLYQVNIYTVYGKLVTASTVDSDQSFIDMSLYSAGLYIAQIRDGDGNIKKNALIIKE